MHSTYDNVSKMIVTLLIAGVAYGGYLLWGDEHHVIAVVIWVILAFPALIVLLDWLET